MKLFAVFALVLMALLAFASADYRVAGLDSETEGDGEVCKCARILDPVCATDSQTYPNSCEFLCAQKKLARRGRSIGLAHAGSC